MRALRDGGLVARARGFHRRDFEGLAEIELVGGHQRFPAVDLPAEHLGLGQAQLTANFAPVAVQVDLQSAVAPIASVAHSHVFCRVVLEEQREERDLLWCKTSTVIAIHV